MAAVTFGGLPGDALLGRSSSPKSPEATYRFFHR